MFQKTKMKRMAALLLAVCLLAGGFSVKTEAAAKTASSEAAKIVKKNAKSGTAKEKLKKMFSYVEKNYGYDRATGFKASSGWQNKYALEMYSKKKGSCYHFAAAYGYLAKKAAPGYQVRIAVGKTNGFGNGLQGHAWTEVKIGSTWYICDTNLDKFAAKSSQKYYLKKQSSLKKTYNNYKGVKYYAVS